MPSRPVNCRRQRRSPHEGVRGHVASDCLSNDRIQRQVFEFFADHGEGVDRAGSRRPRAPSLVGARDSKKRAGRAAERERHK
jgi:hypothetical protein